MRRRQALVALAAGFLLPGALVAQTASYTFFGTSSPDAPLSAKGTPKLNSTFHLVVRGGWAVGNIIVRTFIHTGVSRTQLGPYRLPLPLEGLSHCRRPSPIGCLDRVTFTGWLLTSSDLLLTVPYSSEKETAVPIAIPNDQALLGVNFYQQSFVYSDGVNGPYRVREFHFSRGGHGLIGT